MNIKINNSIHTIFSISLSLFFGAIVFQVCFNIFKRWILRQSHNYCSLKFAKIHCCSDILNFPLIHTDTQWTCSTTKISECYFLQETASPTAFTCHGNASKYTVFALSLRNLPFTKKSGANSSFWVNKSKYKTYALSQKHLWFLSHGS